MKIKLYKWQRIIIWVLGVLTFISVSVMDFGKGYDIDTAFIFGYLLDLVMSVGFWILILWAVFKIGNLIYLKSKKKNDKIYNSMDGKTKESVQKLIQALKEREKSGKNYPLASKEDLLAVQIKYLKLDDAHFKKFYKVKNSRDYSVKELDSYKEGILNAAGITKNYRDIFHTLLYDFCDDKITADELLNKLLNFNK